MRFAFTDDQLQIRDAVRDALRGECAPAVVRAHWQERATGVWDTLAELGVLAMGAPEDHGGLGMGVTDQVLPLEEAGRAAAPGPFIEALAAVPTLIEAGEVGLAEAVTSGEQIVTVAAPGGFALDADIAAAVLRCPWPGEGPVELVRAPTLLAQPSVDGARRLFSVAGQGLALDADATALFDRAALFAAATLIGLGRQMLDLAVAYAKERRQFGKPIGAFQAVQHHLADALIAVEMAAPTVYRAAWELDAGSADASVHVSSAKSMASDAAHVALRKSLQVHGAIGYTLEYDLHMWMKRTAALSAAWGDAAWHRARIGDQLLE
jgi:alkylation response protein AidB-like acyl-CoA dehydrogenase